MTSLDAALLSGTLALAACGSAVDPEPPLARVDLRAELDVADANVVGVAVDPDGRRFVLDEAEGLFELTGSGSVPVVRMNDMPDPGVEVALPYTDLAALGRGAFALTAIGAGFLLEPDVQRLSLHFCYEPGFFPEEQRQAASALAYDSAADRIYAQPQTFQSGVEQPVASQIGAFDRESGADLEWYSLTSPGFRAGGMAIAPAGVILLGAGASLVRFDSATGRLATVDELTRYGIVRIEGLTVDPAAATLLAIDADADELVEVPLDELAL